MSNTIRRKGKKARKRRNKGFNSWAYVIFASIIDVIFSYSWHEAVAPESIFDLSSALDPKGRERQEKLGLAFCVLIIIAGISMTVYIHNISDSKDWIGVGIITAVFALIILVIALFNQKHK